MRHGYKWSPDHQSYPIGSHLFNAFFVTTLVRQLTQRLTGTLYPNTWVICASLPPRSGYHKLLSYSIGACDTTSTTLAYLCWELSRRSDMAKKLQAELDTVMPDCKTLPDITVLQDLPYLSAFVKEGSVRFY